MLMAKSKSNRILTLYRGESRDALPSLREKGLTRQMRMSTVQRLCAEEERLCLAGTSPETMLIESKSVIKEHILSGKRSPFISFSGKERVARSYAADGGRREKGLLVKAEVRVCEELVWEPYRVAGLFIDHANRLWLHVPVYWPMFKSDMNIPEIAEAFRLSYRDDEYLLLGDLDYQKDFRVEEIG